MNSRYPRVDANARGWVELEFLVHAVDMAEAVTKAVGMARAVSGSNPLSCKVASHDEAAEQSDGASARLGRHASEGERVLRPGGLS